MATVSVDELAPLVRQQLEEILGNPAERARILGSSQFGPDQADMLEKHEAQLQGLLADESLAHILNGPVWLSGASVVDGTITADKIAVNSLEAVQTNTGTLNVTGDITAAASFPATGERIVLNSEGLTAYADATTETFKLNVDGSGFIGIGSSKVSWTDAGLVTVPAAAISNLTIADVESGLFGGTYESANSGARISISTSGLLGYNALGTETFNLSATDGSLSMVGIFTLANAATGARVEFASVGLRGYNSSGTQTFGINASDGSGFLGAGSVLTWNSSGQVAINGSVLATGTVTANKLSVPNLAAISADLGTITAGSITAGSVNASVINTGTLTFSSGGVLNGTASIAGTLSDISLSSLTVTGTITVSSGGRITWGNGDYVDNSGMFLQLGSSETNSILWRRTGFSGGAAATGRIGTGIGELNLYAHYTGSTAQVAILHLWSNSSAGQAQLGISHQNNFYGIDITEADFAYENAGSDVFRIDFTSGAYRQVNMARIYPGTGTASQTTRYIYDTGTMIALNTGTDIQVRRLYPGNQTTRYITDTNSRITIVGPTEVQGLFTNDQMASSGGSGSLPNPTKYWAVQSGLGVTYYVPLFTSPNPWTA